MRSRKTAQQLRLQELELRAVPANLVVNGSFEDAGLAAGEWGLFTEITGWAATDFSPFEVQNFGGAAEGDAWVELDGWANAGMSQQVPTAPGETYRLTFAYSPRPYVAEDSNPVDIFWDGQQVESVGGTSTGLDWREVTVDVVADSGLSELEFRGSGNSDALGGFIDDVRLESANGLPPVPPPPPPPPPPPAVPLPH